MPLATTNMYLYIMYTKERAHGQEQKALLLWVACEFETHSSALRCDAKCAAAAVPFPDFYSSRTLNANQHQSQLLAKYFCCFVNFFLMIFKYLVTLHLNFTFQLNYRIITFNFTHFLKEQIIIII